MLKIFTIKYSEKSENFPDSSMSDFLADREVLRWESHFFERKGDFFWTVLVEYEPSSAPTPQVQNSLEGRNKKEDDYKSILAESDWPLFKRLKEWRGERCKEEGVPPYIICTNIQLARVTVMRPASLNSLQSIDGIGKSKIEKYGKEILQVVASFGKPLNFTSTERDENSGTDESISIGENNSHEGTA